MKNITKAIFLALVLLGGEAGAAVCTSIASGNWNTAATWSCNAVPGAADTVIIASPHAVSLSNASRSAGSLTINAGATLDDNGRNLTVSGSVIINGTYDGTGNNGNLVMTGNGQTLSGTGTIIDIGRIQIDGNTAIAAGSNLNLTLRSEIRVGSNSPATLTINGTIDGTAQTAGNRIIRVDNNNAASVIINGAVNAPNSFAEIQGSGTVTNNGTVTLQYLDGNGDAGVRWTQGTNSNLTFSQPAQGWAGTFDASAIGNTVTFNGTATPISPATYYNIAGAGVTCPYPAGITVLGTSPCGPPTGGTSVTANPTVCTSVAGIGTQAWSRPGRAVSSNNSYATAATTLLGTTTDYLQCTGYNFAIPAGAIINGITVNVERKFGSLSGSARDAAVRLVDAAGTIGATDRSTTTAYANQDFPEAHGGAADLWGATWTAADINSANFGAAFAATASGVASTVSVDHMPITVTYSLVPYPAVLSINTASPNPTTPATAVSWTVVFSESVTGVDAADFVLVPGGGVAGASITGVTGSGTTWTVTANTGSGTGTLGLNLIDDDTIANGSGQKLGGTGAGNGNFTGQVYTVELPMTCVTDDFAAGVLDTTLWNVRTISGAFTPQVVDAGGGDFRLRLTDTGLNEATFAQLKRTFPGAGNKVILEIDYFAYGGTGADGIAVTFSDSAIFSTTGGFGGSLGYANRTGVDGFGGGWLGIGLDEYGNFPNPTEGRLGYPAGWVAPAPANAAAGFYKTNVSVRGSGSAQAGYSLLANTGVLAPAVNPPSGVAGATPYRYRVTIDHGNGLNAWVTVERDDTAPLGDAYTTLIPAFDVKGANSGQAAVPPSWLISFTGSTGGSTNFHEFKRVRVCANMIAAADGPHHLEIQHDGSAIACAAEAVVVKACADGLNPCTPYTGGVDGNLTAGGNSVAFSIPSGQSQTAVNIHLPTNSALDPQTVRLGTSSVLPATTDTNSPYCNSGGPLNNTTACDVSVYKAGFLFDVPHLTSGTASGTVNVSAVRSSDSTTCVPLFRNVTRTVAFWGEYQNPASGTLALQVNGSGIETTAAPAYTSTYSLTFGNTGVAALTSVQYNDVGLMQLNARYVGSTSNVPPDGGMIVLGSDTFAVKPHHFDLSAIKRTSDDFANPAAADATGMKFVKAGEAFSVTVTARNALNAVTPNYGQEMPAESVKLNPALVAGLGLANNPAIGGSFGAFTNGVATGTAFTWNEVGIITLTPSVADADYLGAGDTSGTASGNVGRFYAGSLALSGGVIANRSGLAGCAAPAGCGSFTYMGEQMSAAFNLTAKAVDGTTTLQNYNYSVTAANNFAKFNPAAAGNPLALAAVDTGAPRTVATLDTATYGAASGSFSGGDATVTAPFAVTRGASPSGPFEALDIGVNPVDDDGAALAPLDLAANAGGSPNTHGKVGSTKARYGRLKISNAHGSELLPLTIAVTAQYWDGATYITNPLDNNSSFAAGDVVFSNPLKQLAVAEISVSSVSAINNGNFSYVLAKPNGGDGKYDGSVDMAVNALSAWLPSNTARATFGVYKGNNEFIYLRENY